jgi:hypothetical protein
MAASVFESCVDTLSGLAGAVGLSSRLSEIRELADSAMASWGAAPIGGLPASDVSPDGSPAEFALAIDGADIALQVAIEPLTPDRPDGFAARVSAAESVIARVATRYDIDVDRWLAVADTFLPTEGGRGSAVMVGAELGRTGPPLWKVWLYPGAGGDDDALYRVRQGLERLGCGPAWPVVRAHAARGFGDDQPVLFAVDLSRGRAHRVKVYFRHHHHRPSDLARHLSRYPGFARPAVRTFGETLTGGVDSFAVQAPVTCVTFCPGRSGSAAGVTVYFPLWTYPGDDQLLSSRVRTLLASEGIAPDRYDAALAEVAGRPLDEGTGIHNYLSWQPRGARSRVKVYFSPELRSTNPGPRYAREERDAARR